MIKKYCECGCGNIVNERNRFIRGHNRMNFTKVNGKYPSNAGFKKGITGYWKNKKRYLETNNKVKISRLQRKENLGYINSPESRIKMSKNNGMKKKEFKEKLSIIRKEKILNGEIDMSIQWETFKKNRVSQIFPKFDTKIEVKIQNFLKQLNINFFTHQYIQQIEHGYQCDIFIPSMNLVIECDGNYWHKYPIGNDIDHIRTKELLEKGFKVLRLWEHEIKDMNIDKLMERIQNA